MIEWLREDKHRTLLVHNKAYATDLKGRYEDVATQIDSFDNFLKNKKGFWPRTKEIAVDNIDIILQSWFNAPVQYVTFTGSVDFKDSFDNEYICNYEEQKDPRFKM